MKVLIVLDNIHTGGISKSLLNLLPNIAKLADCDLLVFKDVNIDKDSIPADIRLIVPDTKLKILGMSQEEIKHYSILAYMCRAILVLISRIVNGGFSRKILFSFIKQIGDYDIAISYSQDVGWKTISTGCNQFVLDKVNAKTKLAYIHCDYERFGGYHPKQEKMYSRFDKIICVSKACMNSFSRMFPKLREKCFVSENFTNIEDINSQIAEGCMEYSNTVHNFVTVCRLGREKGIQRTVEVLARLKREGYKDFKWTIVGGGPDKEQIEKLIEVHSMSENIDLVGQKNNPYVYIKNAEFFLLPSYHEAAPMVFGEAVALGVPVVTTNTISAKELIEDRGYGVVCENSVDGIYSVMKKILDGDITLNKLEISSVSINQYAEKQLEELLMNCCK